ncbi:SpoIIE family protein phosphatase [Streptomyces sp. M7]|uniref:SpoIIE family protein phosphatase n=1 Tax=Streptomyces sp. M7 TaxID=255705 RepID=UPI000E1E15DD|nr:SpoIIE family protein phosphatase [Streptomyces sp. M7]RDS64363.1 GAF domain-containing protein [Streptomyces sp. M7]
MASSTPGRDQRRCGSRVVQGSDLAEALNCAAREARRGLNAVSAAVYLLDEDQGALRLALAGGSAPSFFTFPGRMALDMPSATARAWATGRAAVLVDPDPAGPDQDHVLPYPYVALSAPVASGDRRFGALTVLRVETAGVFGHADTLFLEDVGRQLAAVLAHLVDDGVGVAAGPTPMLVPAEQGVDTSVCTPGWGVRDVPGSSGTSMMFPLRRLAELLNRATTMDDVVSAAQYCVMSSLRADALVLLSAREGRLWVLGHSGDSTELARRLHGAGVDDQTPAAAAFRGRPLYLTGERTSLLDATSAGEPRTEAYLPLRGDGQFVDLPFAVRSPVVAVCCLAFSGPRRFPSEERVLLGMMAGLLGAAVERVELIAEQHEAAQLLQRFLLPAQLPDLPRLVTTARYRPADVTSKVGGDWFDVFRIADDRAVLVIGDVEGHAVESAAVMGQVRTAMASYATEGHRPAAMIDRTGRVLAELGTALTVTCCVVALDTLGGTAEVALAGHPAPLVRHRDGTIEALDAPANVPLGVPMIQPYEAREYTIESGSILMLYTNGLVSSRSESPETCARDLLGATDAVRMPHLEDLAERIVSEVVTPQQRRDDAALLLARYEGAGRQEEPRAAGMHIQRRDLRGVGTARAFVHEQLGSWGLEDMADVVELAASEIVTNALIHAGSDVDLRLRIFEDHLRLEVRDSDTNPPIPSALSLTEEEAPEAEHGRGMLIVESLADEWTSYPNGQGKTVALKLVIPQL